MNQFNEKILNFIILKYSYLPKKSDEIFLSKMDLIEISQWDEKSSNIIVDRLIVLLNQINLIDEDLCPFCIYVSIDEYGNIGMKDCMICGYGKRHFMCNTGGDSYSKHIKWVNKLKKCGGKKILGFVDYFRRFHPNFFNESLKILEK